MVETVDADTASGDMDVATIDADATIDDVETSEDIDTAGDADCESSDDEVEDGLNTEQSAGSLATVISGILRKKPAKHKVILAKAKTDKRILTAKRKLIYRTAFFVFALLNRPWHHLRSSLRRRHPRRRRDERR